MRRTATNIAHEGALYMPRANQSYLRTRNFAHKPTLHIYKWTQLLIFVDALIKSPLEHNKTVILNLSREHELFILNERDFYNIFIQNPQNTLRKDY